jgi:hypothetical protein
MEVILSTNVPLGRHPVTADIALYQCIDLAFSNLLISLLESSVIGVMNFLAS